MHSRVIVALDHGSLDHIESLVDSLDPARCKLKVGKGLFTRFGPDLVRRLVDRQFDVFLDLKFHDIPTTVAAACRAAADLGVWMLNVHALGGRHMLTAARRALEPLGSNKPLLIAVTLLTSLDDAQLAQLGMPGKVVERVTQLAKLAQASGIDGVVCSAQEATQLRQICGQDFCLVTPGIRLVDQASDDQQRIMSPGQAIAAGADYLVIGRPITQAVQPLHILQQIELDIQTAGMS